MGVLLFFCLLLDDKVGILDVKAKIDGHINCDIEAAGYDKGLEDGKRQGIEAGVELGKKQGIEAGVELGKKQGIEIGNSIPSIITVLDICNALNITISQITDNLLYCDVNKYIEVISNDFNKLSENSKKAVVQLIKNLSEG